MKLKLVTAQKLIYLYLFLLQWNWRLQFPRSISIAKRRSFFTDCLAKYTVHWSRRGFYWKWGYLHCCTLFEWRSCLWYWIYSYSRTKWVFPSELAKQSNSCLKKLLNAADVYIIEWIGILSRRLLVYNKFYQPRA